MEQNFAMEIFHELKKTIKRLWILVILFALAFLLSNLAWFIYEMQFTTVAEQTQIVEDVDESNINQEMGE